MKNIISKLKNIVFKNWRKTLFLAVIIFIFFFAYSIYILFNGVPDKALVAKVETETQSTNIKFDEKTIDKLLGLKLYSPPTTNITGKNPFQPY